MLDKAIIALDVGGSSVKSGLVHPDFSVTDKQHTPINSNGTQEEILNSFAQVVQNFLQVTPDVEGVGVGFPSPFDYDNGICLIQGVAKYEAIYGVNIGDAIRERLNRPDLTIKFRNDAESALVGEARYGAGKPYQRFIGVTLGTGIGSGFLVDGERVTVGAGVPPTGFLFPVDYRGQQADEWFSTRGLLRRFQDANYQTDAVYDAVKLAREGDVGLQTVFAEFGTDLADFLAPFIQKFGAEALLVTGGIANAYDLFNATLESSLSVPVIRGALGEDAALLGASDLLR